jgi:hypothetical protein
MSAQRTKMTTVSRRNVPEEVLLGDIGSKIQRFLSTQDLALLGCADKSLYDHFFIKIFRAKIAAVRSDLASLELISPKVKARHEFFSRRYQEKLMYLPFMGLSLFFLYAFFSREKSIEVRLACSLLCLAILTYQQILRNRNLRVIDRGMGEVFLTPEERNIERTLLNFDSGALSQRHWMSRSRALVSVFAQISHDVTSRSEILSHKLAHIPSRFQGDPESAAETHPHSA